MTEQEAIKKIKNHFDYLKYNWKPHPDYEVLESLRLAISVLEKQIPKEPFRISGIDSNDNAFVECPICKAGNETSIKTIKQIYCWKCGQSIKWE